MLRAAVWRWQRRRHRQWWHACSHLWRPSAALPAHSLALGDSYTTFRHRQSSKTACFSGRQWATERLAERAWRSTAASSSPPGYVRNVPGRREPSESEEGRFQTWRGQPRLATAPQALVSSDSDLIGNDAKRRHRKIEENTWINIQRGSPSPLISLMARACASAATASPSSTALPGRCRRHTGLRS